MFIHLLAQLSQLFFIPLNWRCGESRAVRIFNRAPGPLGKTQTNSRDYLAFQVSFPFKIHLSGKRAQRQRRSKCTFRKVTTFGHRAQSEKEVKISENDQLLALQMHTLQSAQSDIPIPQKSRQIKAQGKSQGWRARSLSGSPWAWSMHPLANSTSHLKEHRVFCRQTHRVLVLIRGCAPYLSRSA